MLFTSPDIAPHPCSPSTDQPDGRFFSLVLVLAGALFSPQSRSAKSPEPPRFSRLSQVRHLTADLSSTGDRRHQGSQH